MEVLLNAINKKDQHTIDWLLKAEHYRLTYDNVVEAYFMRNYGKRNYDVLHQLGYKYNFTKEQLLEIIDKGNIQALYFYKIDLSPLNENQTNYWQHNGC